MNKRLANEANLVSRHYSSARKDVINVDIAACHKQDPLVLWVDAVLSSSCSERAQFC